MSTKSKDLLNVFRWHDFLSFGLIAIIATAINIFFIIKGENVDTQTMIMLIVVSLAFFIPYVVVVVTRKQYVDKIDFITRHGLPVATGGFDVSKEEIETITDETIDAWENVIDLDAQKSIEDLFIFFKPFPIESKTHGKLAGYLLDKHVVIGWKPNLRETALAHEIGHEIHRDWVGHYSNEEAHEFMRKRGL